MRRVQALLRGRVGVDFTEEGQGAVYVCVPGDRADSSDCRGRKRRAGVHERLPGGESVPARRPTKDTKTHLERGGRGGARGRIPDTLVGRGL